MSKLAKIDLMPAAPPLVEPRRALLVTGYVAVLVVLGYLTIGAFLRTQVLELDLQLVQTRIDLANRTAQRERQVAAAEAANDAKQKLVDELSASPLWSEVVPELLARLPAGVTLASAVKLDRAGISFDARAKTYQDLTTFRDGLKGTRYANITIKGPEWDVTTRDFTFSATVALEGGK